MNSKIYIARCTGYWAEDIYRHLQEFFQYVGGIRKYVKPGMKVLIKPNICGPHAPETAAVTHPVLVEQIVNLITEAGAAVTIGDNSIGQVGKKKVEKIWEITGMKEVIKKTGCSGSILDSKGFIKETLRLNGKSFSYFISKEYLDSDLVINVPKFKTHALMGFTGAIKNTMGIIPGRLKVHLHSFAPLREDFAKVLVEVYSKRIPELTIMDAIEGMEGNGPTTRGQKRKIGILMASTDGLLVDSISARIMGLNTHHILTNVEALNRELGNTDSTGIYLNGFKELEECFINDFMMPTTFIYAKPEVIKKYFELAKFNITIDGEKCTGCLQCRENCPTNGILNIKDKLSIDETNCIQCLCCLEICPVGAIDASKNKFYIQLKKLREIRQVRMGKG